MSAAFTHTGKQVLSHGFHYADAADATAAAAIVEAMNGMTPDANGWHRATDTPAPRGRSFDAWNGERRTDCIVFGSQPTVLQRQLVLGYAYAPLEPQPTHWREAPLPPVAS